jgi:uncharacterized repeat protein (TIGR03803 family)
LLSPTPTQAQANIIYSFGSYSTDGSRPGTPALVADSAGNLYGTTVNETSTSNSTAFELSPQSGGEWTDQILFSFAVSQAESVGSTLVFDGAGNLYGVSGEGGTYGYGVVFELSPSATEVWTYTALHEFQDTGGDGVFPRWGLLIDPAGNLFGATTQGGAYGYGTVFRLSRNSSGTWTEQILHSFNLDGVDGSEPNGPLAVDASGILYGTTYGGGADYQGTVFALGRQSNGTWSEKILHSFVWGRNVSDGSRPAAGVLLVSGKIYGTTISGGAYNEGTVFELAPRTGSGWHESVIHSFKGPLYGLDGSGPEGNLTLVGDSLYGTTVTGGSNSRGTVFGLTPSSGGWTESFLYSFAVGGPYLPNSGLLLRPDGNLYGTAQAGGANGDGCVFEIAP